MLPFFIPCFFPSLTNRHKFADERSMKFIFCYVYYFISKENLYYGNNQSKINVYKRPDRLFHRSFYLIKTMRQRKSLPIRFQRLAAASYMTKRKPNIITPTSIRPSFLLMLFIISRQSFQQRKPYRNTWSAADYILT